MKRERALVMKYFALYDSGLLTNAFPGYALDAYAYVCHKKPRPHDYSIKWSIIIVLIKHPFSASEASG